MRERASCGQQILEITHGHSRTPLYSTSLGSEDLGHRSVRLQQIYGFKDPTKVTAFLRTADATLLEHALAVMKENGLQFNAYQCSAAMTSYKNASMWPRALSLFLSSIHNSLDSPTMQNVALGSWASGSRWKEALDLLQQTPPSRRQLFACSAALSACGKSTAWQAALTLMKEMLAEEVHADVVCYNTLISACGKGGQWTLALEVLQEMKRKMRPSNASYSATISACEKAFRWREALALLEEAHAVRPQLSCFNAAISACEKCHKWQMALNIFQEISQRRQSPDRISFNACISACAGESIWTIALHLLQQMPRCQLTPGAITRSAVITACEKALQWQVVLKILDQPGFGRGSATELHQAMWYLSKQAPSSQTQLKALQGAREATGLVDEFKVKQLVSLLRSFASMLVTDRDLFHKAAASLELKIEGSLQTQELANVAWAFAVSSSLSSGSIFDSVERTLTVRGEALLADHASICTDPMARDYAEGMLGVVWSLNYAGVLSQRFLDFAHQTLYQLTELEGCFAMEPVRSSSINAGLPLLLETGDVAVLQKPAGWQVDDGHQNTAEDVSLLSTLVRSMTSLRRFHLLSDSAFSHGFLHRLDVPTSGLILVAKTHRAFYDMRLQLASGLLKRDYTVLCHGFIPEKRDEVRSPVHWWSDGRSTSSSVGQFGRPSITIYYNCSHYLGENDSLCLVSIRILTGRKHQIRVHSAHIGHPVVCDERYSAEKTYRSDMHWCPRSFLHRSSLQFRAEGRIVTVSLLG
ncbi:unnamed protein product [Durusdinium trenchii]|uniref:Pseudouridine synthase RsuA/RluA-like domain-containing protein n=2 Tax=Durusdinium trenchii TaxID=1381693 RepID=A0ABP0M0Z2_9DINO